MWYVVKTSFGHEDQAVEELKAIPVVKEIYLPYNRRHPLKSGDVASGKFRPTINGILFINVSKDNLSTLKFHLNTNGYFVDDKGGEFTSKAHLLNYSRQPADLTARLNMAKVTVDAITLFRILNDQSDAEKQLENVELFDSDAYRQMSSKYDTVCIVDGPYFKFQGIIKTVSRNGVKDKHLFINTGSLTISISDIHRYNYIVVREAPDSENAKTVNTWRFIDYLIGRLQSTYFADNAGEALRSIIRCLSKGNSIDKTKHLLFQKSLDEKSEQKRKNMALQATFLESESPLTISCLGAVASFFRSSGNSVEHELNNLIPDVQLRPFLTPVPGKTLSKGSRFTCLRHKDFLEVILRLDLRKRFADQKYKLPKGVKTNKNDYVYYAHIGLKANEDNTSLTCFINWSGFMNSYLLMENDEKSALLDNMQRKGYRVTPELLRSGNIFCASPELAGFKAEIECSDAAKVLHEIEHQDGKFLSLSMLRPFAPFIPLFRRAVSSAVELWQNPKLACWRKLCQRYVLLHKTYLEMND
jgi:hypothetical protein